MEALTGIVFTTQNLIIVAAVAALLTTARRVAPSFFDRPLVARSLPVAPLLLCTAALWMPGVSGAPASLGDRVLLGCILGAVTASAWKVLAQSVFGKDERIQPAPPALVQP